MDVLRLLATFSNETSFIVWESLVSTLNTFNTLFSHTDFHSNFQAFARNIFQPTFTRLGWESKKADGGWSYTKLTLTVELPNKAHFGTSHFVLVEWFSLSWRLK